MNSVWQDSIANVEEHCKAQNPCKLEQNKELQTSLAARKVTIYRLINVFLNQVRCEIRMNMPRYASQMSVEHPNERGCYSCISGFFATLTTVPVSSPAKSRLNNSTIHRKTCNNSVISLQKSSTSQTKVIGSKGGGYMIDLLFPVHHLWEIHICLGWALKLSTIEHGFSIDMDQPKYSVRELELYFITNRKSNHSTPPLPYCRCLVHYQATSH